MGNAVADEAAKIDCNTLHRVITDDLRRLFSDARAQQQSLEAQYALRIDLAMHRVKLDNEHDRAPERQLERWEHMHSYALEEGQKFVFTAEDFHNVRSCKFGRRLADLILRWLQLLVWPTSPEEVTPPLGITWVEMTVRQSASCFLHRQRYQSYLIKNLKALQYEPTLFGISSCTTSFWSTNPFFLMSNLLRSSHCISWVQRV